VITETLEPLPQTAKNQRQIQLTLGLDKTWPKNGKSAWESGRVSTPSTSSTDLTPHTDTNIHDNLSLSSDQSVK